MKFEHDTVLQEYGVDRKPDIRQFHKLPGIHKEPMQFCNNPSHEPLGSLMDTRMSKIESHHIAEWKLNRLNHVANGSVVRDKNFLSHVFSTAKEWGYMGVYRRDAFWGKGEIQ